MTSSSEAPPLEVRDLTIRFGQIVALEGVSLSLPPGASLAVLGPNGGGKSTLLKALVGLLSPNEGDVSVFGASPRRHDPRRVSYVPQIKELDRRFPAVAEELVASGIRRSWPWRIRKAERDAVRTALRDAGIEHLAQRDVASLSGGQLQRVYLARGLVRRPDLLLLDEPATGIDVPGQAEFLHLLEAYRARTGAAVVLVTHDWAAAEHHATHVALLNRRLLAFGPPRDVMVNKHLAAAFGHAAHAHPMAVGGV